MLTRVPSLLLFGASITMGGVAIWSMVRVPMLMSWGLLTRLCSSTISATAQRPC